MAYWCGATRSNFSAYAPIANHNMKRYIPLIAVALVIVLGILIAAMHTKSVSNQSSGKLRISTSFYPLYYFASFIAGDKAVVQNITPSGAEPHDYDPSTGDITSIEKGNLLILNGGVEAWGDKIQANLKGTKVTVVTAGEGLLTQQVTEDGKNQIDPHVWLDPIRAKQEAQTITTALVRIDPQNTVYYETNQASLDTKLDALNAAYKTGLADCSKKDVITSHAAFGYLATRYGLTQVPIAGLSPDAEPSAQQLADVANFAKEHGVTYIFFESLVSPKLSQTIASEIGAQTLVLDPIEGVSADDMKAGKNYYTIMQDNLKNLQLALQCNT